MIIKKKKTVNECTCNKCGKEWESDIEPVQCPKCKSPNWNRVPSKEYTNI